MYLHIAEPKTADQLIGRLTEIEKMMIRKATNPDALEYIRVEELKSDMVSPDVMLEVKKRLDQEFRAGLNRGYLF